MLIFSYKILNIR